MSAIDKTIEENMVCATVNAPHSATSATIQAYLAAHRPDRLQGETLSEAADSLGTSKETVRTQVKTVCAKRGVSRQSELILMLAKLI
jgi:DNA-binding NarL/FixJ family response regulator